MTAAVITEIAVSLDGWSARLGSAPAVDAFGCGWFLGELDGWKGGVPVVSAPTQRSGTDGVYAGRPVKGGRSITMSGTVTAPNRAGWLAAMDRFSGLLENETGSGTLVINETAQGVSRQATVIRDQTTPRVAPYPQHPFRGMWSMSLLAPDPLRYSTALHSLSAQKYTAGGFWDVPVVVPWVIGDPGSSGFMEVQNAGNAPVWPRFRIRGPITNPTVRLVGGPALSLQMTLTSSQEVVIDSGRRSVLLGTASRRQQLTFDSQWFRLPKGASQLYVTADAGTGTVTVEWRDAWA